MWRAYSNPLDSYSMKNNRHLLSLSVLLLALTNTAPVFGGADQFANATSIGSTSYKSDEVSILTFTKQTGEPNINEDYASEGKTAWWKWTAPENGFCTVNTFTQAETQPLLETVVGVFTGVAVNALTQISSNAAHWGNTSGSYWGASCTFYAVQGSTYYIAVDSYDVPYVTATSNRVVLSLGFLPQRATRKIAADRSQSFPELHHSTSFSKTSTFSFSARIKVGRTSHSLRGVLSPEGFFMGSLSRPTPKGSPPLAPIGVMIDAKDGKFIHLGTGNGTAMMSDLLEVKAYPAGVTCPLAGKFTSVNESVTFVTVSSKGLVTGAGRAHDGLPITFSGPLAGRLHEMTTEDGRLPFTISLHGGKGFYHQTLLFEEQGSSDILDSMGGVYVRPANPGSAFYPLGINDGFSLAFSGVRNYVPPVSGERAMGFLNATSGAGKLDLLMSAGEIPTPISVNLNFGTNNRFTFASVVRKPALKINVRTGLVSGSVLDDNGVKRTLIGAVYRTGGASLLMSGIVSGATKYSDFRVIAP
jgi:hypothetical protein